MRYKQILMYMSITNHSDQEIRCQWEKNYLLLYNVMTMHLSLKLLICRMKLRTIRPHRPHTSAPYPSVVAPKPRH